MSRDVVFYEEAFPFQMKQDENTIKLVMPNIRVEDLCEDHHTSVPSSNDTSQDEFFTTHEDDFLPSDDYDPDHVDIGDDDQVNTNNNISHSSSQSQSSSSSSDNAPKNNTRTRIKPVWHQDYIMHCIVDNNQSSKTYSSLHYPPTFPYIQSELLTDCHKR